MDEKEEEYDVEAIRAWRYNKKEKLRLYLLKWVGYPEADNTWEAEANLSCVKMIRKFRKTLDRTRKSWFDADPETLSGFQRNADFIKCEGASEPREMDDKMGGTDYHGRVYVWIRFDDWDECEAISLWDYWTFRPNDAFKFIESRLYCGP